MKVVPIPTDLMFTHLLDHEAQVVEIIWANQHDSDPENLALLYGDVTEPIDV